MKKLAGEKLIVPYECKVSDIRRNSDILMHDFFIREEGHLPFWRSTIIPYDENSRRESTAKPPGLIYEELLSNASNQLH